MADKKKKRVRDIQERTGWPYQFSHYLVTNLGYEYVSMAVDETPDTVELGKRLNKEAKEKANEQRPG
jgi:hypothetical protein